MRSLGFEKLFGNFGDDPVALVAPRKGTNIRRNEYNESRDRRFRAWAVRSLHTETECRHPYRGTEVTLVASTSLWKV